MLELGRTTGPIPLIDAELLRGALTELPPLVAELDPTPAFAEDDVMDSIIEGADITPEDIPEAIELGIPPEGILEAIEPGITAEDIPEAIGLDIEPIDETDEASGDDNWDATEDATAAADDELPPLGKRPDTVLN